MNPITPAITLPAPLVAIPDSQFAVGQIPASRHSIPESQALDIDLGVDASPISDEDVLAMPATWPVSGSLANGALEEPSREPKQAALNIVAVLGSMV